MAQARWMKPPPRGHPGSDVQRRDQANPTRRLRTPSPTFDHSSPPLLGPLYRRTNGGQSQTIRDKTGIKAPLLSRPISPFPRPPVYGETLFQSDPISQNVYPLQHVAMEQTRGLCAQWFRPPPVQRSGFYRLSKLRILPGGSVMPLAGRLVYSVCSTAALVLTSTSAGTWLISAHLLPGRCFGGVARVSPGFPEFMYALDGIG